jgi:hypothetical protein
MLGAIARSLAPLGQPGAQHSARLVDSITMTPSGSGAPGIGLLQQLLNWGGQYGLIISALAVIIGGAIYGVSSYGSGNGYQASRGRTVALAGAAGAVIIGLAPSVINLLFNAAHA